MKRTDHAQIHEAETYLRSLGSGLTKHQLAAKVFDAFPALWDLLTPNLQAKWCWEQRRKHKDSLQLPLDGIFDDIVLSREDWDADQYRVYARRYDAAGRANFAKRDRLLREYYERTNEQLELWEDA